MLSTVADTLCCIIKPDRANDKYGASVKYSFKMDINQGGQIMKGYNTESGFMGYVDGTYILFSCEEDYEEYMETIEEVA